MTFTSNSESEIDSCPERTCPLTATQSTPKSKQDLSFFQHKRKEWESRSRLKLVQISGPLPPVKAPSFPAMESSLHAKNLNGATESGISTLEKTGLLMSLEETKEISRKVNFENNCRTMAIWGNPSSSQTQTDDFKARLTEFYNKYNPSKLPTIDSTLETYRGRETELFEKLQKKYCSDLSSPEGEGPRCFLEISIGGKAIGKLVFKVYLDKCPLTSKNFYSLCTNDAGKLARNGKPLHYKQSTFHRIIRGFMVQGGDFTKGNGTGGESIYCNTQHGDMWGKFKDEEEGLKMSHCRRGLLSMANSGKNTNGSQFFITLGKCIHLDGKHVIFGEIVDGWELLDQIERVETDKTDKPVPGSTVKIVNCGSCS